MARKDRYPTIKQVGDRWFTGQPKRKGHRMPSKVLDTRGECEKAIEAFYKSVDGGQFVKPKDVWTMHELIDAFINSLIQPGLHDPSVGHRPGSIRPRQDHAEHLIAVFKDTPCSEVDYLVTEAAYNLLSTPKEKGGRGLKVKRVEKKIKPTLIMIMDFGKRMSSGLRDNYARLLPKQKLESGRIIDGQVKEPTPVKNKHLRRVRLNDVLTPPQIKFLLAATTGVFFQTIIMIMAYAGLRISEALALLWSDIDVENGLIHVRRTLSTDKIKGLEDQPEYGFFLPKTDAGGRTVEILDRRLLAALKDMKAKAKPDELVFQDENGGPYLRRWNINTEITRAAARAGIAKRVTPHTLRHSFASILFDMKKQDTEISKLMGHANVAITQTIYIHFIERQKKDKVSMMDEFEKYQQENF